MKGKWKLWKINYEKTWVLVIFFKKENIVKKSLWICIEFAN